MRSPLSPHTIAPPTLRARHDSEFLGGLLVLTLGVSGFSQTGSGSSRTRQEPRAPRNAAEFDTLFQQVKNWGRWGPDDQLGSVNLITPAKRKAAVALARTGETVSLGAHAADREGRRQQQSLRAHDAARQQHGSVRQSQYHGYAHSHIDALCHILYKDQTYNGYARADVNTDKGCTKLASQNLKNGIVTRGVLIDIPRLRNLPYLETGHRDLRRGSRGVGEEGGR